MVEYRFKICLKFLLCILGHSSRKSINGEESEGDGGDHYRDKPGKQGDSDEAQFL